MKWFWFFTILFSVWGLWYWFGSRRNFNLLARLIPGFIIAFAISMFVLFVLVRVEKMDQQALGGYVMEAQLSGQDQEIIAKAMSALKKYSCKTLDQFWGDVSYAKLNIHQPPLDKRGETYGWSREVTVTVVMAPRTMSVPDQWRAGGQSAIYHMGGGAKPGVVMDGGLSQMLCGMAPEGQQKFVSIPHMILVDSKDAASPGE
ncbi:MAG: hypothetical protein OEW12_01095 [Deltaproteobacteria bacterium]|nr:hypothetical protein [Deltaproteobacteria bacterium]